jgi:hypothetical protein
MLHANRILGGNWIEVAHFIPENQCMNKDLFYYLTYLALGYGGRPGGEVVTFPLLFCRGNSPVSSSCFGFYYRI